MKRLHSPHAPRKLLLLLALISGAALIGCFETDRKPARVAGGDDYPNGVDPLGKKTAQARADSADWNGFDSIPKSGPGLYDTVSVPDTVPDTSKSGSGGPAPKRSAAPARHAQADTLPLGGSPLPGGTPVDTGLVKGNPLDTAAKTSGGLPAKGDLLDTLVTRVIDTAKGTVEAVRTQVSDSGTRRVDSTVFVPADPKKPGAAAGVNAVTRRLVSADSSRVDLWKFADADGDGLLTARAGSKNLASVELTTTLPGGVLLKKTQVLAAGADLSFNRRGDNRLLASTTLRIVGGDTLDIIRILDADGDSVVLDFGKDSNLVDLIEVRRFATGALESVTRQVRLVASKDSTKNFPVKFSERKVFRDGSVLDVAARGLGPDSAFRAGAEAHWTEIRWPVPADSVERGKRAWKLRLGPVPGAYAANVLLGFSVEEAYRRGRRDFAFDFRCETPVADGRWVKEGEVLAWLTLESGARVVFNGSAEADGFTGQVSDAEGKSSSIRYDLSGALVTSKP